MVMKLLPLLSESMNIFDTVDIKNDVIIIYHDKMEKLVRSYLSTDYLDISLDDKKSGTFLNPKIQYTLHIWFDKDMGQKSIHKLKNHLITKSANSDDMLLKSIPSFIVNVLDAGYGGLAVYFDDEYEYDFIGF